MTTRKTNHTNLAMSNTLSEEPQQSDRTFCAEKYRIAKNVTQARKKAYKKLYKKERKKATDLTPSYIKDAVCKTAWHEAGHALAALICQQPLKTVTVLPDSDYFGCVFHEWSKNDIETFKGRESCEDWWTSERQKAAERQLIVTLAGPLAGELFSNGISWRPEAGWFKVYGTDKETVSETLAAQMRVLEDDFRLRICLRRLRTMSPINRYYAVARRYSAVGSYGAAGARRYVPRYNR